MENHYSGTIVLVIENSATIVSCMQVQFLLIVIVINYSFFKKTIVN